MYVHTHMYTLTHQTLGHTHTPLSIPLIHTASVYVHTHTRVHMYTHSHTKHLDIASYTLPTCFHIAPPFTTSGRINLENAVTRWKWGVGRLIAECTKTPIVIPVWHVGMEDILPTRSPYIPQLFKVRAAKHIQDVRSPLSVLTDTSSIVLLLQYFTEQLHNAILLSFSFTFLVLFV